MTRRRSACPPAIMLLLLCMVVPAGVRAADPTPGPPLTIQRITHSITVDGNVSDAEWQDVTPVTTWFETRVGDNVEPQVKNVGYLAYDDKYFYAAFVFDDPDPNSIRAPLGDHDQLSGSTDYGGLIIDSRNDGKTAQMFLANARGLQYDAISSDVSGEDNAPDYFWDAAGKVTPTGWTLEIRVPFSSLRYSDTAAPTWGMLLYRNYPRDRHYQFFSARLPRDVSCFICNSSKMTGLVELPHGSHLVIAPFATSTQTGTAENGLGQPLEQGPVKGEAGVDVKWSPTATAAIDATINPDFSQIESDVAQIAANERFALFYPEKRPFFLEGIDIFSTPLTAVYTRSITSPSAGLRATGRSGSTAYTALFTQDQGGGSVILPGPQGSGDAPQDFVSDVGVLRMRHDLGQSFVSLMGTAREIHGGGYNRVYGPDFQWRPGASESIKGQFLWSESQTPVRPDLTPEWDGRYISDGAGLLYWSHSTKHEDWFLQGQALGPDFRADNGFIPQVGYSEGFAELGYTVRPEKAFFNRIRFWTVNWYDAEHDGDMLSRRVSAGVGMDGRFSSFTRIELNQDAILVGSQVLNRFRPRVYVESSPGLLLNFISLDSYFLDEIDFANAREGTGATLIGTISLRPGNHLELRGNASWRWLDLDEPTASGRLFTAQVERLRATWQFNSRSFVRLIGQYVQTRRDPLLYTFPVDPKTATATGSALFAYKINWQSVLFLGYGDAHEYDIANDKLEQSNQQFFAKVSYAWQQ